MIIFRADASAQIGTGHIMRCLALGQCFRNAGEPSIFVTCMITPQMRTRLQLEGFEIKDLSVIAGSKEDAKQTIAISNNVSGSWIVIDGYHFDVNYQRIIKELGANLVLIDDNGCLGHYYADIVINQNIHASEELYPSKEPYTSFLLGPRYVLLREEFLKWQGWKRQIPELAQKILVTLGGSDSENVTLKVCNAILQLDVDRLEVVVIGANNQYYEQMKSLIEKSHANLVLKSNVEKMSDFMAWADIAISAGGTSTWELAFMGLPTIMTAIADNQCQLVQEMSKAGAAVNIGWHRDISSAMIAKYISELIVDVTKRRELSMRAKALVDGKGAERILNVVRRSAS